MTCTAMASADYCGEATPNTLSGTPITLYHAGNVPTQTSGSVPGYVAGGPVREDYFFESAWALVDPISGQPVTSATLPFRVRTQAVCLTKKRWSTLPYDGLCMNNHGDTLQPSRVPDPRNPDVQAKYCEEYTRDELIQRGAVLFSYSKFLDAALYRFKHVTTGQYLTTSRISIHSLESHLHATLYQPDASVFSDAANYLLIDGFRYSYEGPLFRPETPTHLFEGIAVSPLLRYRSTSSPTRFITLVGGSDAAVPDGYVLDEVEGYTSASQNPPSSAAALHLYGNDTGDYLTTGDEAHLPEGYEPLTVTPMGYLPQLEHYAAPRPY
ncbi:hypothetical protein STIAU_0424 [Stigmatella aurantiaca DW4/3-1]|uniref:ADYC domain-containing protein n=1 Tax=Stigmatella aurantiaca (strain DW4/3-1) TaxID=378806 RepID=Q08W98_STIAD|nr:hypothetical protein STIAU_0424 [Stigmatella aurantiaca DW4/3-1]